MAFAIGLLSVCHAFANETMAFAIGLLSVCQGLAIGLPSLCHAFAIGLLSGSPPLGTCHRLLAPALPAAERFADRSASSPKVARASLKTRARSSREHSPNAAIARPTAASLTPRPS
jgi:hypothetical protein